METKLKIRVVGSYTINVADQEDCKRCHNANYGDVIVEDICGKCLLEVYNAAQQKDALDLPSATVNGKPSQTVSILNGVDLSGTASQ